LSSNVRHLGLLALGQTPRDDVTPTLRTLLGGQVQILERGGLDGLDAAGIQALVAGPGEAPLETRLRSGAAIALSRERILPRLTAAAGQLSVECRTVLLLCSGEFPDLLRSCPELIQPIQILRGVVEAVARQRTLGLIGPASDLGEAPSQWAPYAGRVIYAAASPYQPLAIAEEAGRELARGGAELIYLDDMGFTESHRSAVARGSGLPALCALTIVARVLCELI
jgi:protein AroM